MANDKLCITIERSDQVGLSSTEYYEMIQSAKNQSGVENNTSILYGKILDLLKKKHEKQCNREGYVLENSTKLLSCSYGHFPDESLIGDINYYVSYKQIICRPIVDATIDVEIKNKNMIGMIADYKLERGDSPFLILIPQSLITDNPTQKIYNDCNSGDMIKVKIISSRFRTGQEQITVIAKLSPDSSIDNEENEDDESYVYNKTDD